MSRFDTLASDFYRRAADRVARDLLGRYVVRDVDDTRLVVRIVETEAYLGAPDRASHAWGDRRTARTRSLFRAGGVAYVYLIYGLHHMLNVVTGGAGDGSAVLLRAGEPVAGTERMARLRRLGRAPRAGDLAGGPGKLCAALDVDLRLDRASLDEGPLTLTEGEPVDDGAVVVGPRIGVDYAGEAAAWPLRFMVDGSPHVSRPRPF